MFNKEMNYMILEVNTFNQELEDATYSSVKNGENIIINIEDNLLAQRAKPTQFKLFKT
jgi:hypothetical protein